MIFGLREDQLKDLKKKKQGEVSNRIGNGNNLENHLWLKATRRGQGRKKWTLIQDIFVIQGIILEVGTYVHYGTMPIDNVLLIALRDFLRF